MGMIAGYSLRPATSDDVQKIVEIERRVHIAPWSVENFNSEFSKPYSQFLVCTDDETDTEVTGYVISWHLFNECQILNLAVDLPFRGVGLAKEMIRKTIQLAVN